MLPSRSLSLGQRLSGLVLHPTSLPGRFGIGDLGPAAHRFIDDLAAADQHLWQVLPLGATHDDGFSPYSSPSAFAGNPLLISPERLVEAGWLDAVDLPSAPDPGTAAAAVDFPAVAANKDRLLAAAYRTFRARGGATSPSFLQFCEASAPWLDDYALFMALRDHHHHAPWYRWPADVRRRDPTALRAARRSLDEALLFQRFVQFEFARQWEVLRDHARARRVALVGDVPIYVAHDGADVWAHPDHFLLTADASELAWEAGVPPDEVFSAEGQRWGTPLYHWDRLAQGGYAWWIERLRLVLDRCDFARLDHFRGFEAYWAVPRGARSAKEGHWRPGPGDRFLAAVAAALGGLPLFAEDIGYITPAVHALRERFGLPGIRIAQFGFTDEADNPHLPRTWPSDCVAYTSTHDTDTLVGWHASAPASQRRAFHDLVDTVPAQAGAPAGAHWDALRLVWRSEANWVLASLQDLLGLGGVARMNVPGTVGPHNWSWRCRQQDLDAAPWSALARLTRDSGRAP
jgi:4-alpha-glucanotransferase